MIPVELRQKPSLPRKAKNVLCWLATVGRPVTLDEIGAMTGWANVTTMRAISSLRRPLRGRLRIVLRKNTLHLIQP